MTRYSSPSIVDFGRIIYIVSLSILLTNFEKVSHICIVTHCSSAFIGNSEQISRIVLVPSLFILNEIYILF